MPTKHIVKSYDEDLDHHLDIDQPIVAIIEMAELKKGMWSDYSYSVSGVRNSERIFCRITFGFWGRWMVNTLPTPRVLSTVIWPPCA